MELGSLVLRLGNLWKVCLRLGGLSQTAKGLSRTDPPLVILVALFWVG